MQDQGGLMGLLTSPVGQGLLAAGLGAMGSRGNTMQAIGRGGLLGLSTFGQAQESQQNKLIEAAKRKAQHDALAQLTPGQDGVVNASPSTLMAAGFADPAKWGDIRNMGRDKVKQIEKTTNADGSQGVHAISEYGGVTNTGLSNAPEIKTQDLGGRVVGMNPYTGAQPWSADKIATIAELEAARSNRAREGLTVRGQNLTDARARESNQISSAASQFGKAPTGYRWSEDGQSLIAITGGPADGKSTATEGERKAGSLLRRLEGSQAQMQAALTEDPGAAKPGVIQSGIRKIGLDAVANAATGEKRQRVEAAQLDMLDAALTLGTGAAYTKEQLEGYRKSYFPQLGDDPGTVKDKAARLNNIIQAARIAAGRSAPGGAQSGGASGSWSMNPTPQAPAAGGWGIQKVN